MKTYVRPTLKKPVALFVAILLLTIGLSILWNVVLVHDYNRIRELATADTRSAGEYHGLYLALGTAIFVAIIGLVVWLAVTLFAAVKFNQQMSMFLASVSHELNSPLSAIKLYAQTLRSSGLSEEERLGFVTTILANVDRLTSQIRNILRAAQEEQDRLSPSLETVSLGTFLSEYANECRGVLERRSPGGEIRFLGGGEFPVRIDTGMFRQILDNLVDNAVKYAGKEPPKIEITCCQGPDGRAAIEVADHGRGIPQEVLPRLFERFRRFESDVPAHRREGIGLGLSIVRSLVGVHGGTVDARSEGAGMGTTFRIVLPRAEAHEVVA